MIRPITFTNEEYYHICNRGVLKREIFKDGKDWLRLLFTIMLFQSPLSFNNIAYDIKRMMPQITGHPMSFKITGKPVKNRVVELISFCVMPNHFHLLVKQTCNNGVSKYLQRIQNSYTKFFNTKYQTSGHLFQGPFRAVHIGDNDQLLYVSAYIHLNPRSLNGENPEKYKWSSYQDYLKENRWGELLKTEIISGQFKNKDEYKDWVRESGAKDLEEEMEMFPE